MKQNRFRNKYEIVPLIAMLDDLKKQGFSCVYFVFQPAEEFEECNDYPFEIGNILERLHFLKEYDYRCAVFDPNDGEFYGCGPGVDDCLIPNIHPEV